ncbi:MAG: DEAD/DEAH box helicase [Nitrososphaerales archaeon]
MTEDQVMELRPYQSEAVKKAITARKSTIKAATGTGKTIIAIAWLKELDREALIIVPTQALIFQAWAPKLTQYGLMEVGQYYANAKTFGKVTLTTFSSATSHPELLDRVDTIIVDEIHHLGAQGALRRLLPKLMEKEYVLGLSSIPEREDQAHQFFLKEFPICFDLTLGTALKSGFVSPILVEEMPATMSPSERAKYEMYTSKIQKAFKFCGSDIRKWARCFDPSTRQFIGRQGMWAMSLRKKLLSNVEGKKEKVLEVVRRHAEERIILFAESVPAIEAISEYLKGNEVTCETFHSGTEPWRRMELLEEWGTKFQVLLSCRALEEGLDVKEVAIGILITSGKSKRQFVQRIGRVIRPVEGKVARFYVVYSPNTVEETYSKTIEDILTSE